LTDFYPIFSPSGNFRLWDIKERNEIVRSWEDGQQENDPAFSTRMLYLKHTLLMYEDNAPYDLSILAVECLTDRVCGVANCIHDESSLVLCQLASAPNMINKGAGKALMYFLQKYTLFNKDIFTNGISVQAFEDVHEYYLKFGFEITAVQNNLYSMNLSLERIEAVIM
jgi:hypothetical protein